MSDLILEQDGRILRATFNRTEDCSVSDAMAAELSAALGAAHETSDMVLLRSAGADFCTGRARNADAYVFSMQDPIGRLTKWLGNGQLIHLFIIALLQIDNFALR